MAIFLLHVFVLLYTNYEMNILLKDALFITHHCRLRDQ